MSSNYSAPSRTRRRKQTRGKWVVLALLIMSLIGALLARKAWDTPLPDDAPTIREGVDNEAQSAETPADPIDQPVDSLANALSNDDPTGATDSLADDSQPDVAIPIKIQEPTVLNAVIGYDQDGNELLTVSGTGDARCATIRFLLDGNEVGTTIPDADGSWALTTIQLPTVGKHTSELECEAETGIYTAAPRDFELPQPPALEPTAVPTVAPVIESPTAEDSAEDSAETPLTESDPATNPDDNQTESESPVVETDDPQPTLDVEQPTLTIAQDLAKYVGGPILLRGVAKADELIEIIFDNGQTKIVDTARANADGNWHYRGMLIEPGEYTITAQLPGTVAEPLAEVAISADVVFGSKGNCVNKTPPFGTIEGDNYIINHCEYFSLIADRLGITFAELRAANQQLINLDYLKAGDVLIIPTEP